MANTSTAGNSLDAPSDDSRYRLLKHPLKCTCALGQEVPVFPAFSIVEGIIQVLVEMESLEALAEVTRNKAPEIISAD
jgi:hypothetical protein